MANNCYYYLKAVSKDKASLERLLRVMRAEDAEYFIPGVREADPIDIIHHDNDEGWCEDDECFGWHSFDECEMVAIENAIYASDDYHMEEDYYCLVVKGQVAWDGEEWFSGEDRPKEVIDGGTAHLTSLNVIAKEFGVGIEVWAHEEFYSFQQHFVMNSRGELAVSETKDWNGYSEAEIYDMKSEFDSMDDDEKECCPLNDPDFKPDEVGFGDAYCTFLSTSEICNANAEEVSNVKDTEK